MAARNWIDLLLKAKKMVDNINRIKGMISAINDLNMSEMAMKMGKDQINQIPSLNKGNSGNPGSSLTRSNSASSSDAIVAGLSTISSINGMNEVQVAVLSNITGISSDILLNLAMGDVPQNSTPESLNELTLSLGNLSGMGDTVSHLSEFTANLGKTDLTPEIVQSALVERGGLLPGMPSAMGQTLQDAKALFSAIEDLQRKVGGAVTNTSSTMSALFPTGTLSADTLHPDILESVGIDPSKFQTEVRDFFTGGQTALSPPPNSNTGTQQFSNANVMGGNSDSASGGSSSGQAGSSLTNVANSLTSLSLDQLSSLTSWMYSVQNIKARLMRVLTFQKILMQSFSKIGISINI